MNAEKLISCVFVRPELWDQKNKLYSTREAKVIAWAEVGDELGVSGDAAKFKWTSLRDVFRREIKRTLRTSIGRDGISQGRSKWVHFNSMLFLKDQMSIDTQSGANFPQNYIDGDTIKVEDADGVSNFPDGDSLSYVDVGNLGAMTSTSPSYTIQPPRRRKRRLTESEPEGDISETGKQREWFSNGGQVVEDEDYHFLMSVLPSVRQVAPGRKTSFRMKVLELIREEESFVLSERTSFDEYRGGSADNQAQEISTGETLAAVGWRGEEVSVTYGSAVMWWHLEEEIPGLEWGTHATVGELGIWYWWDRSLVEKGAVHSTRLSLNTERRSRTLALYRSLAQIIHTRPVVPKPWGAKCLQGGDRCF
uniref:MADF domain-containing protein n=1 Tax=Timema poppense TaxID=170557 RepID=A0A7R9DLF3_TIMPO|nr:unnamed protein product [Timema poppensis]